MNDLFWIYFEGQPGGSSDKSQLSRLPRLHFRTDPIFLSSIYFSQFIKLVILRIFTPMKLIIVRDIKDQKMKNDLDTSWLNINQVLLVHKTYQCLSIVVMLSSWVERLKTKPGLVDFSSSHHRFMSFDDCHQTVAMFLSLLWQLVPGRHLLGQDASNHKQNQHQMLPDETDAWWMQNGWFFAAINPQFVLIGRF